MLCLVNWEIATNDLEDLYASKMLIIICQLKQHNTAEESSLYQHSVGTSNVINLGILSVDNFQ